MSFKKDNSINELTESIRLINTKVVKLETNKISIPVYGQLSSLNEINIVSEVNGIFYGENFKTGMQFFRGDTLAYIKYDEIESNLNSQKSILLNQTSKIVSEIKFDFPDLFDKWYQFMQAIDFNKPLPNLPDIANNKLKNYLSGKNFFTSYFNAKSLQERLNKHLFIAEFNGSLSDVNVKPGTAVVFGQQIAKYHNSDIFEFESSSTIKNTLLVNKNMPVLLKSDEFDGIRNGYVARINKSLNSSSQNMSVFIQTNDNDLYNGMYVYGEIIVGEIHDSYLIKRNLIDNSYVFIIKNNKLVSKKIDVIQIFEENAIIQGVNNNDRLLNDPIKGSYNGMEVRYKE